MAGLVYSITNPKKTVSIEVGSEVDTRMSGRGVYYIVSSSSSYSAIFISGYNSSANHLIIKNGLGYSTDSSSSNVIYIKQENGGNIILKNNYTSGSARSVSIQRIAYI